MRQSRPVIGTRSPGFATMCLAVPRACSYEVEKFWTCSFASVFGP